MPSKLCLEHGEMVKLLGRTLKDLCAVEDADPDAFIQNIAEKLYEACCKAAAEKPAKNRSGPSGWKRYNEKMKAKSAPAAPGRLRIYGKTKPAAK